MENKKDIEKSIREIMDNLSPDQIIELKEGYKNIMDSFLNKEIDKLNSLKIEKQRLEDEKNLLVTSDWDKRSLLNKFISTLEYSILNQENIIKSFKNGGIKVNIIDQYDYEYSDIPDFRKIETTEFTFDENNINSLPVPAYVPFIDEKEFKRNSFVFDSIRVTEDSYLISINRYDSNDKKRNNFIIVTLDQLVLIIDYYTAKQKAKNIQNAKEANERSRQSYFNLSEQERRRYMFQRGIYRALSPSEKKKISEEEFEKLDLEGREKYYLPIKRHGVERIVSKLDSSEMNSSFHRMYQDFINKEALPRDGSGKPAQTGRYADPLVWQYWVDFSEMIGYKLKDIRIQREDYSDTYKQALETSFGESNVDPVLKYEFGILVKRQNGDKINPVEIKLIKESWIQIQSVYGNLKAEALKHNLKISHSGQKLMFAMKALGVYISQMGTIGVSNKLGENDFKSTFAHEVAHFIDNFIGELNGKRWATDNYESLAGKIAFTFRNSMNKNKKQQTDYINATKECFARALQQYFMTTKFGVNAITMNVDAKISSNGIEISRHPNFVNEFTFESDIKPMIQQFLSENLDVFETTIDLDGTNDLAPITEEQAIVEKIEISEPKLLRYNIYDSNDNLIGQDYQRENGEWMHKWVDSKTGGFERGSSKFRADGDNKDSWKYKEVDEDFNEVTETPKSETTIEDIIASDDLGLLNDETTEPEPEENIQDVIEGLEVLKDSMDESERKELEEVIEGLKLLI